MGDVDSDSFILACPTVPVIRGSEVRFSIPDASQAYTPLDWPLAYVSCGEIAPPQVLRSQWGVPTAGPRYDSYSGVRIGSRAVIGAGSVVTRDVPEGVLAAGNPCRVIREITE